MVQYSTQQLCGRARNSSYMIFFVEEYSHAEILQNNNSVNLQDSWYIFQILWVYPTYPSAKELLSICREEAILVRWLDEPSVKCIQMDQSHLLLPGEPGNNSSRSRPRVRGNVSRKSLLNSCKSYLGVKWKHVQPEKNPLVLFFVC